MLGTASTQHSGSINKDPGAMSRLGPNSCHSNSQFEKESRINNSSTVFPLRESERDTESEFFSSKKLIYSNSFFSERVQNQKLSNSGENSESSEATTLPKPPESVTCGTTEPNLLSLSAPLPSHFSPDSSNDGEIGAMEDVPKITNTFQNLETQHIISNQFIFHPFKSLPETEKAKNAINILLQKNHSEHYYEVPFPQDVLFSPIPGILYTFRHAKLKTTINYCALILQDESNNVLEIIEDSYQIYSFLVQYVSITKILSTYVFKKIYLYYVHIHEYCYFDPVKYHGKEYVFFKTGDPSFPSVAACNYATESTCYGKSIITNYDNIDLIEDITDEIVATFRIVTPNHRLPPTLYREYDQWRVTYFGELLKFRDAIVNSTHEYIGYNYPEGPWGYALLCRYKCSINYRDHRCFSSIDTEWNTKIMKLFLDLLHDNNSHYFSLQKLHCCNFNMDNYYKIGMLGGGKVVFNPKEEQYEYEESEEESEDEDSCVDVSPKRDTKCDEEEEFNDFKKPPNDLFYLAHGSQTQAYFSKRQFLEDDNFFRLDIYEYEDQKKVLETLGYQLEREGEDIMITFPDGQRKRRIKPNQTINSVECDNTGRTVVRIWDESKGMEENLELLPVYQQDTTTTQKEQMYPDPDRTEIALIQNEINELPEEMATFNSASSGSRHTDWLITFMNFPKHEEIIQKIKKTLAEGFHGYKIKFAVYQSEICPKTSREHSHLYIKFTGQLRFNTLVKLFGVGQNYTPIVKNYKDAPYVLYKYITKGSDNKAMFTFPDPYPYCAETLNQKDVQKNERALNLLNKIVPRCSLLDVCMQDINCARGIFQIMKMKYAEVMLQDRQDYQGPLTDRNLWLYGGAGSGKSTFATTIGKAYPKNSFNKWWDGYVEGKFDVVYFDDFPAMNVAGDYQQRLYWLKTWSDRKSFPGESKGTIGPIDPTYFHLVITCNWSIDEIVGNEAVDADAVKRRFCQVKLEPGAIEFTPSGIPIYKNLIKYVCDRWPGGRTLSGFKKYFPDEYEEALREREARVRQWQEEQNQGYKE